MRSIALTLCALFLGVFVLSRPGAEVRRWTPASGRAPAAGDEYLNAKDGSILVFIPGGEFTMGSDSGDADEKPAHRLKIDGFWMGKFEITNHQYRKFIEVEGDPDPGFLDDPAYNSPEQPVIGVKFMHGQNYVGWAGLRMPTEAEWEYAAAAGKQFEFPTENGKLNHDLANFLGKEGRDRWEDVPAPVGSFPANPFGIHDLAGNAWEWTSSLYRPYPYSATDGREDLTIRRHRVMRGGSYHFGERYVRTTHRHHFAMHLRLDFVGLRVAASTAQLK